MGTDIILPFVSIGLAELGDKTQLAILLLSSKTRRHFQLLAGVMLAFFLVDGLAVLAGTWIMRLVPLGLLRILSGSLFILVGILILKSKEETDEIKNTEIKNPFYSGFLLILLSEFGDKTQIAAGLFATKYNPWMVLTGALLALLMLSLAAIYLGKFLAARLAPKIVSRCAGILFVLMGTAVIVFG